MVFFFSNREKFFSNGFTLIEVLVAVAIFSVSIIVLFHAFTISLHSIVVSEDYTKAKLLLQKKMSEFERDGIPDPLPKEFENFSEPFSDFKWVLKKEEEQIKDEILMKLNLTVQLPKRSDERIVRVLNYINIK